MKLLLIDDDLELSGLLEDFLTRNGYAVDVPPDGISGLARALTGSYAMVLLGGMMPGLEVLRQLRRRSAVPVIMLPGLSAPADRVEGLESGADDYLAKPFTPDELLARIRAVLRRVLPGQAAKREWIREAGLTLDCTSRTAQLGDTECTLTTLQYEILEYLMRHAGRAVSRDELTTLLHQRESTPFERWLDVHISQLRKKIEIDGITRIRTIRGVGYLFAGPSELEDEAEPAAHLLRRGQ